MINKTQNMYTYHVREMVFVSTCKKISLKIAIYSSLLLIGIIVLVLPQLITKNKNVNHHLVRYPTDLKYILFWKQPKPQHKGRLYANKTFEFPTGQTIFIDQKCPNINCYITYDKNILFHDQDYNAVVFDIDDVRIMNIKELNFTRAPEQIYIFRSLESSERYPICDRDFDKFFNWTWTYKLNSDLPQPFFNIYDERNVIVGPQKKMKWVEKMKHTDQFDSKTVHKNKAVAWIVSKCKLKTKHQDFLKELRMELKGYNYTVDIFGPCGQYRCGTVVKCQKLIEKNYFFQLVTEEYLSEDYVTSQIVTAMAHFIIPIVVGTADYRHFLPPSSYINANAFDIKKLGALIDYLVKNIDMYTYFFDWKNHYYFKESSKSQLCNLCKKLNDNNITSKNYRHFRYWWDPEYRDICQRIRLYKMFNTNL